LLRAGTPVTLAPKTFDTLVYLVRESARLVTRDELMKAIWPDSFVEDANLTVNISLLRKALGDMDNGQPYIETVPRKGYRFNAGVVVAETSARLENASTLGKRSTDAVAREPALPEIIPFPELNQAAEPKRIPESLGPSGDLRERWIQEIPDRSRQDAGATVRAAIPAASATRPEPWIPETQSRGRQDAGAAVRAAIPAASATRPEPWIPVSQSPGRQDAGAADSAAVPAASATRPEPWIPESQSPGRQDAGATVRAVSTPLFRRWLLPALVFLAMACLVAGWLLWRRPQPVEQLTQRRLTSFAPEMAVTAAAISTGSKFIAYANPGGLFVQVISTGDTHPLVLPAPRFQVSSISWFPDSARLLIDGSSPGDATPNLWIVPVIGSGRPVELGPYPSGVVSPDGSEIACVNGRGATPEIQLMRSEGGAIQTLLAGTAGEFFGGVSWSHRGHRLFFTRYSWNPQFRRNSGSIDSYDIRTRKTTTVLSGRDFGGDVINLPDGRLIYSRILGANPSANGSEILSVNTDPHTGRATGSPSLIAKWDTPVAGFTVNAGGTRLVFRDLVVQHSAYVGELERGREGLTEVHRLSFGAAREDYPRAWTPDSKAVFLDSNRSGNWEIFKQALDSDADQAFVQGPDDQFSPSVSPDGAWLLYMDRPRNWHEPQPVSLMRVPIRGGLPMLVLKASEFSGWGLRFECPRVAGLPCVLAQREGKQIVFRTFDPENGFQHGSSEIAHTGYIPDFRVDWCLAPDGLKIAWVHMNPADDQIHLVPLARSASGLVSRGKERNVTVSGGAYLHAIAWSPDGRGWFLVRQFPESWTLAYANPQGKTFPLLTVPSTFPTDVFPSPDGRHLAFSEQGFTSNVWLLEHF
jgi:DNA-binding winged helix-turn-helix (wHTH) protein/Tol biopolymer transport system component